ncbi:hypothetical protein [Desulfovirgula thermocuniculi]|uniref:hypothetical protein n=1 Tax=Desulfovirgula thermocuniculi TaxID=348842 RepID=UPI00040FAA35|nr:hypothetical protein [Desulfovirgula thermocuniculi]
MGRKGGNGDSIPLLHVYGQSAWHDDVFIVGNRQALKVLLEAVKEALDQGKGEVDGVFAADGEGYGIVVIREDDPWPEGWEKLALPYTEDYARDRREGIIWPGDLVK